MSVGGSAVVFFCCFLRGRAQKILGIVRDGICGTFVYTMFLEETVPVRNSNDLVALQWFSFHVEVGSISIEAYSSITSCEDLNGTEIW